MEKKESGEESGNLWRRATSGPVRLLSRIKNGGSTRESSSRFFSPCFWFRFLELRF